MKINVTKMRRDAYDCRYSHMVIEPIDVMQLCDEIVNLRAEVTKLGGDPFNLTPADTAENAAPALDDPVNYPEGHKVAEDYMQKKSDERGDTEPEEPPQPAEIEQEPTHTDNSEQQ